MAPAHGEGAPAPGPAWQEPAAAAPREGEAPAAPPAPVAPPSTAPPAPAPAASAAAAPPPPAAFEAMAARMGRTVERVSPVFRAGAVLLLAASLLLVAENALVFSSTAALGTSGALDLGAPSNASSANNTVSDIQTVAGGFLSGLSLATTLDLAGFALLGAAMALLALGSRGVEIRMRFDGAAAPIGRRVPGGALLAAACFFSWVGLTVSWRLALTGSPTGDWSGVQSLFDASGVGSGSAVPAPVARMIESFPAVTGLWIAATLMLVPAAAGVLVAGAGFKRATGLRAGGVGFLVFAVVALVGVVVFVGSIAALFEAVERAFATGGEGIEEAFASLAVAMVVKLLVIPFFAVVGFSLLAVVGLRFALLRPGAVLVAPADLMAIRGAGTGRGPTAVAPTGAPAAGGAPAGAAGMPPDPGTPAPAGDTPAGDIVVDLPPGPPTP